LFNHVLNFKSLIYFSKARVIIFLLIIIVNKHHFSTRPTGRIQAPQKTNNASEHRDVD
jgi:hypothetical protein